LPAIETALIECGNGPLQIVEFLWKTAVFSV
jgi:hypothetical protein